MIPYLNRHELIPTPFDPLDTPSFVQFLFHLAPTITFRLRIQLEHLFCHPILSQAEVGEALPGKPFGLVILVHVRKPFPNQFNNLLVGNRGLTTEAGEATLKEEERKRARYGLWRVVG